MNLDERTQEIVLDDGTRVDRRVTVLMPPGHYANANALNTTPEALAAMYAGMRNANAPAAWERGPCEVCSSPDQVLYQAPVRAADGVLVRLACCWDCQSAIRMSSD